jgi:hypothetical protein
MSVSASTFRFEATLALAAAAPLGALGFAVVRPPVPAYLDADWWQLDSTLNAGSVPVAAAGVAAELVGAVSELTRSVLANDCFWGTGEPEKCELACQEQAEECDIVPVAMMPPLEQVRAQQQGAVLSSAGTLVR